MKKKKNIQKKRERNESKAKSRKRLINIQHCFGASIPEIETEIREFGEYVSNSASSILGLSFEYLENAVTDEELQPDFHFFQTYRDLGLNLVLLGEMLDLASKKMISANTEFMKLAKNCFSEAPNFDEQQKRFEELLGKLQQEFKK